MTLSRWTHAQLESGGWIRRMSLEGQRLRKLHGDDAVADLSIGQPLAASEAVGEAFRAAAAERFPERFEYMPNLGYEDVRERAARDVDFAGVDAASIAITPGAAAAMCVAIRTFVDPGDDVIGIAPYFPEFRLYCETASARFVPIPSRTDLGIDLDGIAAALSSRSAAVILNSPCNPSGHVVDATELSALVRLLRAHAADHGRNVMLFVDEVYRRLTYHPHVALQPLSHYEHTVLARSFSKDLGIAGERIGYLVLHPSLVNAETHRGLALAMRALGFVNAPATAQRALVHLESWEINIAPYRERRDLVVSLARNSGLDAAEPDGGLYLWIRSPWRDTIAAVEALAEQRVLVTPGVAFGAPDHIRLCFSATPAKLTMAMDALADIAASPIPA